MSQEDEGFGGLFANDAESDAAAAQAALPKTASFELPSAVGAPFRLVQGTQHHSLWGHRLWNASKYMHDAIFAAEDDPKHVAVKGRLVVELGAGLGVPSLCALRAGARMVTTTDYPDEQLLSLLKENVSTNAPEELEQGRINVFGLKWGDKDHIRQALELTGGSGYDVVILSDLVFNHVCHHELLTTTTQLLCKNPASMVVVAYTHHRPNLTENDLNFFRLLPLYGLRETRTLPPHRWPPMFEDDPGDADVRSTVHARTLSLAFDDEKIGPIDAFDFDVVIEGTGLVESIVSASLAMHGVKVLHLDAHDYYGGDFATSRTPQFEDLLKGSRYVDPASVAVTTPPTVGSDDAATAALATATKILQHRDWALDVFPMAVTGAGDFLEALVRSPSCQHLELQLVQRLVRFDATDADAYRLLMVPLSRADVFKHKALGPMDMRRVMKFAQDVMALDATAASPDAAAATTPNALLTVTAALPPATSLAQVMTGPQYNISARVGDLFSLSGQLLEPKIDDDASRAVNEARVLKQLMSSVGRYEGETPFLVAQYGSSELPQIYSRSSAVYGGVFALHRSISSVFSPPPRKHASSARTIGPGVLLDNGQWVGTHCVLRRQKSLKAARVVILSSSPFITWEQLETACGDVPRDEEQCRLRAYARGPLCVGAARLVVGGSPVVAMVHQFNDVSRHAPDGHFVVHVTYHHSAAATSGEITPLQLRDAFVSASSDAFRDSILKVFAFSLRAGNEVAASTVSTIRIDADASQHIEVRSGASAATDDELQLPREFGLQGRFAGFDDSVYYREAVDATVFVLQAVGRVTQKPSEEEILFPASKMPVQQNEEGAEDE